MNTYIYDGPVTSFGRIINKKWTGYTRAVSAKKAKNNLQFRYKRENGLSVNSKVELPGNILLATTDI